MVQDGTAASSAEMPPNNTTAKYANVARNSGRASRNTFPASSPADVGGRSPAATVESTHQRISSAVATLGR
jgi:hypothetical protein